MRSTWKLIFILTVLATLTLVHVAGAQEPFLGEIRLVAFTFAPRGWAFCHGQLLPISQHTALFSLLGTIYGGDGRTTFALPDLRGRVPIGAGTGPGLTPRSLGERGGAEGVQLTVEQLPAHTHRAMAHSGKSDTRNPEGNVWAKARRRAYSTSGIDVEMDETAIGLTGGGNPVETLPPFLGLNYVIALQGIYPSRD